MLNQYDLLTTICDLSCFSGSSLAFLLSLPHALLHAQLPEQFDSDYCIHSNMTFLCLDAGQCLMQLHSMNLFRIHCDRPISFMKAPFYFLESNFFPSEKKAFLSCENLHWLTKKLLNISSCVLPLYLLWSSILCFNSSIGI